MNFIYKMPKPKALNAIWRDITLNVTREVNDLVDEFTTTGLSYEKIDNSGRESICLDIFVDDDKFSVNINTKNEVRYVFDGRSGSKHDVMEMVDVYIYSAKTVCYQITKTCHFDDMTVNEFEKEFKKYVENMKNDEVLRSDVYKYQTFAALEVTKSENDDKFFATNTVTNIVDAWNDDGEMDDDALNISMNERQDLFYEKFWSRSSKRIISEQKRILRTIEYMHKSQISFLRFTRKCILNLKNKQDHHIRGYKYSLTSNVIDDYYRYTNTKNHAFLEELVQVAWEPERFKKWCLDTEEEKRIESYCHT